MQVFLSQLTLGLVNGSFYAMLSLGLAVIFGLLGIVNFAHGALYMLGAYVAFIGMDRLGINYWAALIVAPIVIGALGVVDRAAVPAPPLQDRPDLRIAPHLRPGADRRRRSCATSSASPGQSYDKPELLAGSIDLGFMVLPIYRAWVVVASLTICLGTWFLIERTSLGATLRAGTENPALVQAFGINVPLMVTLTYAGGAALAAIAGVLAAPIIQVTPLMGSSLIIVVFAVVVIGGMGSILGSILTGLALGLVEGLTKVFYPEASSIVVFVIMAIVLMVRPAGLFGKEA